MYFPKSVKSQNGQIDRNLINFDPCTPLSGFFKTNDLGMIYYRFHYNKKSKRLKIAPKNVLIHRENL